MRPVTKERLQELRRLSHAGYSNKQIAQSVIPGYKPKVGKTQLKVKFGEELSGKSLATKIKAKLKEQLKTAVKTKLGGKPQPPEAPETPVPVPPKVIE